MERSEQKGRENRVGSGKEHQGGAITAHGSTLAVGWIPESWFHSNFF